MIAWKEIAVLLSPSLPPSLPISLQGIRQLPVLDHTILKLDVCLLFSPRVVLVSIVAAVGLKQLGWYFNFSG